MCCPTPITLLGHVHHSLAWQTGDDHTQFSFWAHMEDILKVVDIHIGKTIVCLPPNLTDVAPLPSHFLWTYTLINGLLHSSFQPCDPVWCPEARHFPNTCILFVLFLMKVYCWSACRYRLVLPKKHAPDNPPPHFAPAHSCLVTHIVPHPRPICVAPTFQKLSSGTRNESTSLGFWCHTTLEIGVVFSETFSEFMG